MPKKDTQIDVPDFFDSEDSKNIADSNQTSQKKDSDKEQEFIQTEKQTDHKLIKELDKINNRLKELADYHRPYYTRISKLKKQQQKEKHAEKILKTNISQPKLLTADEPLQLPSPPKPHNVAWIIIAIIILILIISIVSYFLVNSSITGNVITGESITKTAKLSVEKLTEKNTLSNMLPVFITISAITAVIMYIAFSKPKHQ